MLIIIITYLYKLDGAFMNKSIDLRGNLYSFLHKTSKEVKDQISKEKAEIKSKYLKYETQIKDKCKLLSLPMHEYLTIHLDPEEKLMCDDSLSEIGP